jgi:hypothetical protein
MTSTGVAVALSFVGACNQTGGHPQLDRLRPVTVTMAFLEARVWRITSCRPTATNTLVEALTSTKR